jgi:hypothetical protein
LRHQNAQIMKSVRIASTVKHLDEAESNITLFQIREILNEHRSTLVMRILGDLPTYLAFKFNRKIDKEKQQEIRDKLFALSNSIVSLDKYDSIVQEILTNKNYTVPSQPFIHEIDVLLDAELNPSQLTLVR